MLGFPASTEFGKRIPKQKFYENLDVSPALRRVFVDQIRLVYWRNKLAASTLNIAAGETVTEVEVFEVRLNEPQLDEAPRAARLRGWHKAVQHAYAWAKED